MGAGLFAILGTVLFFELAITSFVCGDSTDSLCAWRGILDRLPLYLGAVAVILLIVHFGRRTGR